MATTKKEKPITAIKALFNCGASGDSLVKGKTYKVPADVSEADARTLVRMGRAEDAADAAPEVTAEAFAEAVAELDPDNTDNFNSKGEPELKALKTLGINVKAATRSELWSAYQA